MKKILRNDVLGEIKLLTDNISIRCEYRQPASFIYSSSFLFASKKKEEIKVKAVQFNISIPMRHVLCSFLLFRKN